MKLPRRLVAFLALLLLLAAAHIVHRNWSVPASTLATADTSQPARSTSAPTGNATDSDVESATQTNSTSNTTQSRSSSTPPVECRPQINVGFLKTHKCASTTIQNMLFRFGLSHNLTFMLPEEGNYIGVSKPFRAWVVRSLPWHRLGYNIHAVHNRWNHADLAAVMPANTTFVTTLRQPVAVFRSLYAYAEHDRVQPLERFVARRPISDERFMNILGRNQMLWDLGLPQAWMDDRKAVDRLIAATERHFHLVMIAERMDESLVLLKHLLCWRTADVVGLPLNALRQLPRAPLSRSVRQRLRHWQAADHRLYAHFAALFERRVTEFGAERMRREVAQLRAANRAATEECGMERRKPANVDKDFAMYSGRVYSYQPRTRSQFCVNLARPEVPFINLLRRRQLAMARRKRT